VQIDLIRPDELTAEQAALWSAWQAADPALDTAFLAPEWVRAVERAHRGDPSHLGVAVLRDAGEVCGFLALKFGTVTALPAGAPMCDYQGLVMRPGAAITPRELVGGLGLHRLDFTHWIAEQAAFEPHMRGVCRSHIIDVTDGYAAYEAERRAAGTGVLKDIDKKRRKVERELGEVRFTPVSRSSSDFDQLLAWKREQLHRTHQTDIFAPAWTRTLLADLFDSRDPDFGGALFTLHIGEKLAAAQFNLRASQGLHCWIIAHDPGLERYSPGMLMFQDIVRWMEATPYSRLDLGPGDVRFKLQMANAGRDVGHGFVGVPSPATLMRTAVYRVRQAAESLPLGRVSELPGKAMRRMDQWRGLR
jgi:CelD/BcsL family acetyltransferase involved in cellulose biosynthesis